MKTRPHFRTIVTSLGALALLPLACIERADHDIVRGLNEEESGDGGTTNMAGSTGTGNVTMFPDDINPSEGTGGATGTGGSGTGGEEAVVLPNPLLETCSPSMGMGGMPSVGDAQGDLLIDDFEDGDNVVWGNGLSGRWEAHNDETEGYSQSPLGGFRFPESTWTDGAFDAGYNGSTNSLHMTGSGFDSWGSGQSLYFAQDNDGFACLFDATEYAGITFWARGSVTLDFPDDVLSQPKTVEHGKVRVHIVDRDVIPNAGNEPGAEAGGECDQELYECWDAPLARIEPADCWQKYVLPFADMQADKWSKWLPDTGDDQELDVEEIYQIVFEVSEQQSYELWIDDISFYTSDDVPAEVMGCN